MQLCYGYLLVSLGSKGLKLILLSIKDNDFYENSYTLGGGGHAAMDLALHTLALISTKQS